MSKGKRVVLTKKAPAPVGPYSQGIINAGVLYISGQIPLVPGESEISEDILEQTHQTCKNLLAVAKAAGARARDFLKVCIYLTNIAHFPEVNEVYASYFKGKTPPARVCFQVCALPKGVGIMMDAVVALHE